MAQNFRSYWAVFVIACLILVAFAIVRHHLMDIEIVIRRTAVFAGLFAFVYGIFTVSTIFIQKFFIGSLGWSEGTAVCPAWK